MTVSISDFNTDGTVLVTHDDHSETAPIEDVVSIDRGGSLTDDTIIIFACPVDEASTSYSMGSTGEVGDMIQRALVLFRVKKSGDTITQAKQFVKQRIERNGGEFLLDADDTQAKLRDTAFKRNLRRVKAAMDALEAEQTQPAP